MKTILTLLLILSSLSVFSQKNKEQRQERIRTLKVGFLTERLDLSSEEAQGFWPIYNAFDIEIEALRSNEFMAFRTYRKGSESLTDEQAQNILNTILEVQQKRMSQKTSLANELKGVISIKKVLALFKAEEDFKRQLLRELRKRKS